VRLTIKGGLHSNKYGELLLLFLLYVDVTMPLCDNTTVNVSVVHACCFWTGARYKKIL